ncbi:hypothetical protein L7F22_053842 [Adiantum nelumboides]|nr:hypothetical protein [Adiantum nelumboides]
MRGYLEERNNGMGCRGEEAEWGEIRWLASNETRGGGRVNDSLGSRQFCFDLRDTASHQLLSFHTSFTFNITTYTKYDESGDGIAFVITTDQELPSNSTGRFLGLMPEKPADRHQQFMAIEFDTFQNLEPEILDPSASHIGIDISSLASIKPILRHRGSVASPPPLQQLHNNRLVSGNNSETTILYSWNFTIVQEQKRNSSSLLITVLVSIVTLSLVIAIALPMILRIRKLAVHEQRNRTAIEDAYVSVHRYRYNELKRATQNFSEERKIGRGGFSIVYKGILRDDTIVAIKKMKDGLVEAEIIAREVQIISKLKHRNLLELEGWCYEKGEALLVYKYMPKGSLDSYL